MRFATAGLCALAAWLSWSQSRRYTGRLDRLLRARIGAALISLIGVVCIVAGINESIRHAGLPIHELDWIRAFVDVTVPVFYLYALQSFSKRDELEGRLAAAARHDPLTGLPNRAGFGAQALSLLDACRGGNLPATLVMLDIDRFKLINDGWGHGAGDDVLRGVARAARESVRTSDVFARYGGEEFILLMINVTPQDALPLVERVRASIAEFVPHPGAPEYRVTISAGLAAMQGHDIRAIEAGAKAADAALYIAKEAGRDRAVIASPAAA